jgi:iron complex outermembrane receptor protein
MHSLVLLVAMGRVAVAQTTGPAPDGEPPAAGPAAGAGTERDAAPAPAPGPAEALPPEESAEVAPPPPDETESPEGGHPSPPPEVPFEAKELAEMSLKDLLDISITTANAAVESATKTATRLVEVPSIVTVLPRALLRAHGIQTMEEALRMVSGLHVVNDLLTANVGVRGIYGGVDSWSRLVKVMVDGHPVTFYSTGGTLLGPEFIPMQAVEAIEVVRGPASALYGGNAFLGVINVRTRQPRPGSRFEAGGQVGFIRDNISGGGHFFGQAATAGPVPASFMVAGAGAVLDRSGLAVPGSSPEAEEYQGKRSQDDLSRPRSLLARAVFTVADGELALAFQQQRLDAHAEFSDISVLSHHNRIALVNDIVSGSYERSVWPRLLTLRLFGSYTDGRTLPQERLDTGDPAYLTERRRQNRALNLGSELRIAPRDDYQFLVGLDYIDVEDEGDQVNRVARSSGDQTRVHAGQPVDSHNIGIYGQALFYPRSGLGFVAGARFDGNSEWASSFSARLGAVYRVRSDLYAKLLYGRSFLPPSPTQLTAAPLRIGGVRGNPDLSIQAADTVEGSLSFVPSAALNVQLALFYTAVRDRIEFLNAGANAIAQNLSNSRTGGLELEAETDRQWWHARAAVTVQDTVVVKPDPPKFYLNLIYGDDGLPPGFPQWLAHLSAGLRWPGRSFGTTVEARLVGERKASQANIVTALESYRLPAYALFDTTLRTGELELAPGLTVSATLRASNLLGTRIAEGGALGVDIPGLGRTVFLDLSFAASR